MQSLSLLALFLFNTVLALAQYTPSTVPNTKLVDNSYVSNPDSLLKESTVAEINSILSNLEKQTTAQVAVVALRSIGDADEFDFAQELFTLWGIGASNNNGLLILLVDNPHVIRFHTGLQIEGALPDIICKQIQRDKMLPSFKEGNYDEGMLNGINEVNKILTDPKYAAEIKAAVAGEEPSYYGSLVAFCIIFLLPIFLTAWFIKRNQFSDSKNASQTDYPQMRLKRITWLIEFGGIPVLIVFLFAFADDSDESAALAYITLYLYLMITVFHRLIRERRMFSKLRNEGEYYEISEYFRKSTWHWLLMAIIFPLPFLIYFPFHFVRKAYYRNHPRKCKLCQASMKKLSETEDDEYLSKAQVVEETIKSVNYDVWKCVACGGTEAWFYLNRFSRYDVCPSCKAIAYYKVSDKTLQAATYSSSGRGETLHQCKACNKSVRKSYSIAQLTHSSSSDSSSSSSSYSSGSSSSGGSWGGGRSGGGGASSTW